MVVNKEGELSIENLSLLRWIHHVRVVNGKGGVYYARADNLYRFRSYSAAQRFTFTSSPVNRLIDDHL